MRSRISTTEDGTKKVKITDGLEPSIKQLSIGVVLVALLFAAPAVASVLPGVRYRTIHAGLTFGYAALGVNMLLRHTKLVSFGHAAFFGISAYAVAVLTFRFGVPFSILLIIVGAIMSFLAAVAIGYIISSYTGIYFTLLTLAFNAILYYYFRSLDILQRTDGLAVRIDGQRPAVFGLELSIDMYNWAIHFVTAVLLLVGLFFLWKLINSPFGQAVDAIGQDRTRAEFIGIPVEKYTWALFAISGLYAGIGGALYALYALHVSPEGTLFVFRSGEILFMAILGGMNTLIGPLVGGIVLMYLLDTVHVYTSFQSAITGLVLLLVVFIMPKGIVGSIGSPTDLWGNIKTISAGMLEPIKRIVRRIGE